MVQIAKFHSGEGTLNIFLEAKGWYILYWTTYNQEMHMTHNLVPEEETVILY